MAVGSSWQRLHLGGIVYLGPNVESPAQVRAFSAGLQQAAPPGLPLFIAIDHEGGLVTRLRPPVTQFPDPMAVGATGEVALARQFGGCCCHRAAGAWDQLQPGPRPRCQRHPSQPRDRSAFLRGTVQRRSPPSALRTCKRSRPAGVIATAKHFPGHGHTDTDSHLALPTVHRSLPALLAIDVRPFQAAIAAGVAAIMTAHAPLSRPRPRATGDPLAPHSA
ncbi:MAG: hypothetical protein KatS3mg061_3017 [Dehalococcoidia bacterium]|nr:MAG: hypothetical protein KatS3mg061_3017 [Dehalococcoidia bacterium]